VWGSPNKHSLLPLWNSSRVYPWFLSVS
jgi:hypothetical protein